eukprot:gb/GECH01010837.1/.p1 GENE.gb/GECH01010837.1/~~gb/GECH01010837.1/.p1  ORF type:complete len:126 (+),score=23.47 gb/GECH01010837.1/:1-378(+)
MIKTSNSITQLQHHHNNHCYLSSLYFKQSQKTLNYSYYYSSFKISSQNRFYTTNDDSYYYDDIERESSQRLSNGFELPPGFHVNWFPGHMAKARKEMNERMKPVDCILEVRDARVLLLMFTFMKI